MCISGLLFDNTTINNTAVLLLSHLIVQIHIILKSGLLCHQKWIVLCLYIIMYSLRSPTITFHTFQKDLINYFILN